MMSHNGSAARGINSTRARCYQLSELSPQSSGYQYPYGRCQR
jgi:hypothetical protein